MRKSTKNITSSQYGDFFLQQIREIGLAGPDDERNKIKARNPEADPPAGQWLDISIFSETPQGDLEITYADLSGNLYAAQDPEVKNPKTLIYKRIRLANPDKLGKYRSTAKMGTFPFITPYVRQLFVNGQQCATLFLQKVKKKHSDAVSKKFR
ncbi:MAG: hypothetical protein IPI11_17750 [Haliscomenobacter sp.]|nr:hypothetical protein [Haliscomenobacter sp.]